MDSLKEHCLRLYFKKHTRKEELRDEEVVFRNRDAIRRDIRGWERELFVILYGKKKPFRKSYLYASYIIHYYNKITRK